MNKIFIEELIKKYNLESLDISDAPRDLIIMLLSDIKSCKISDIKLNLVDITEEDVAVLEEMLENISKRKIPPQYLTNKVYIYNECYYVDKSVLIPRQDTETLIEESIKKITENNYKTMLDLCTGSGVVGISVSCNSEIEKVTLLDISSDALKIANKNIKLNNSKKCSTIESNMFDTLYKSNNKYDIIVSNPPYLTDTEMKDISEFVKKEPSIALYGGKSGLDYYSKIYDEARKFLNDGGVILVEIGCNQKKEVLNIINKYKEYIDVSVVKDINSKDRVIICHFQKQ